MCQKRLQLRFDLILTNNSKTQIMVNEKVTKCYEIPQVEVIEVELEQAMLESSMIPEPEGWDR